MNCRYCDHTITLQFIDLLNSPPSNSFLTEAELLEPEIYYPLKVMVCDKCFLVQVDEFKKSAEIFNSEYVYFSSYSKSWLAHSKAYVDKMIERFGLNEKSLVVEIASNDGYLLQYFVKNQVPVLGIEPTQNTAAVATAKGVHTITEFFNIQLARKLRGDGFEAELLLGNNVLAHVPDILDFVGAAKVLLKPHGVITMEFPHLVKLIDNNQFDTIYHEHFSYLSLYTVKQIFESQRLEIFDVEELPTHGGSLRIYAKNEEDTTKEVSANVDAVLSGEVQKGIRSLPYYQGFQARANQIKLSLLEFLISQKRKRKRVVAYGAAAKGNTLLNYCGIKNDLISYVVDLNPHKQGKFLPGSHIPVVNEEHLKKEKPDYVIIFPWNLKDEITKQLSYISEWGAKFLVAIPEVQILNNVKQENIHQ